MAVLVAAVVVLVLPEDGPPHPDEWDPRVAELADFVEGERGLRFEHPVYVDFLTNEEYSDQVRLDEGEVTDEDRTEMDNTVATLRALGLASGDVDLFEAGNQLDDEGTLAFYDPTVERITVRGTDLTVDLKVTLVHEMTHALQDQHFDLEALQAAIFSDPDLESDDERAVSRAESAANTAFSGYQALVEGDAVRVENAYVDSLSDADFADYTSSYQEDLDQADAELGDVPAALRAFQATPYALGQPLVDLVNADGGNSAVDDMFDDLPSTEEHMLDPLTYVGQRDEPGDLTSPELPAGVADGDVIDEGSMGAVELYIVLAERIDPLVALDAADGWGNAMFVSYEQSDRTCLRLLADGDTDGDDQQLRGAFTSWVQAAPAASNAVITDGGSGRTQIESCDPGTAGDPGNERSLDALTVPAVRSQMAFYAVDGGADLATAWQEGNCFVHQLTFDQMVTINSATDDLAPDLQSVIDDAIETCSASA
jgi:hypothetical protein